MVDYESMTRPELIATVRALEAKLSQAGPRSEAAGPDREFVTLETERKRAEEELRQQKQLLDAIIDNMPVGLTIKDARSLRYLRRNRFSENIVGYSQDECVGKTAFEVFPQERAEAYHASDLRALAGRSMVEVEQTVVTKSGEIRIQLARKVPIFDKHGQPCLVLSIVDDVTERKRAEEELRRQNKLLDQIIETLPVSLVIKDARTRRFLRRNRFSESVLGYSENESVGKTVYDLFPPDQAQALDDADSPALAGRAIVDIPEQRVFTKSGEVRIQHIRKVPILDEHGQPQLLVSISNDITDLKMAEQALRESEEKYRNLVETSRDLIWSTDADGRITFINQAAREIYGYEPQEMLGRRLAEFFGPLHARKGVAFFREMLARDRTVPNYECQVLRKDRTPIILSSNAVVLRDGRGWMTGVTGVSKDITLQKQAEWALRESEERFRLLAENIRDAFWIASSANDRVLYASPAFEDIWGISRDELYRDAAAWLRSIHPEDLPAVREFTQQKVDLRGAGIEYRIVRPDREIRWIWDRSYTMTTGDGVTFLCGIAEDITERKRVEADRLMREIEHRETLIREVHHRIKNHLQGIAGLLRQKTRGNPAFASLAESAVAELHSVAAAFGLRGEMEGGRAELKTMLEAIIASVRGVTGGRISMEYGIDECEQVFVTENEKVALALVLNEVIFNALKHCTERGAKKSARIAVRKLDGSCRITVSNKGRLAPGFSFARGRGMGSGLELVKSLLPPKIVALTFTQAQGMVNTMLTLAPPLIATGEPVPAYREGVTNASAAEAIS